MVTDNDYIKKWFSELSIEELVKGGRVIFDMGNGFFEEMTITEVSDHKVLEYTWDKDLVRFEFHENGQDQTHLVFKEFVKEITEHTPRDIAGWHLCLDAISDLLDIGHVNPDHKDMWEDLYRHY